MYIILINIYMYLHIYLHVSCLVRPEPGRGWFVEISQPVDPSQVISPSSRNKDRSLRKVLEFMMGFSSAWYIYIYMYMYIHLHYITYLNSQATMKWLVNTTYLEQWNHMCGCYCLPKFDQSKAHHSKLGKARIGGDSMKHRSYPLVNVYKKRWNITMDKNHS